MIYLIKIVGMPIIKIGYSENFEKRLFWIRQGMPFDIEVIAERSGSVCLEKDIHKICADYAIKGEWYADLPFVRDAFFCVYDRFPGLNQKQVIKAKEQQKRERIMAFGRYRFNLCGEVVAA